MFAAARTLPHDSAQFASGGAVSTAVPPMNDDVIRIRGARQNNLRNLSLDLALNRLTVVTGVSEFDTRRAVAAEVRRQLSL